jgi:uncharacterized phage-like protein YoqJ
MKTLISGHRLFKLKSYNTEWIKEAIEKSMLDLPISIGLSGMASGVDLWFCQSCLKNNIPYMACVPFEGQEYTLEKSEREIRGTLIDSACELKSMRNSQMIEKCDCGIIVFDGNKGGTHNVFQQMIESKKPFMWINPVAEHIYKID